MSRPRNLGKTFPILRTLALFRQVATKAAQEKISIREALRRLGINRGNFQSRCRRHRSQWRVELEAAGLRLSPAHKRGPLPKTRKRFDQVARVVAEQCVPITEATRQLDVNLYTFRAQCYAYPKEWEAALEEAGIGGSESDGGLDLPPCLRARIRKAALLLTSGLSKTETAKCVGVTSIMMSRYVNGPPRTENEPLPSAVKYFRKQEKWARRVLCVPTGAVRWHAH